MKVRRARGTVDRVIAQVTARRGVAGLDLSLTGSAVCWAPPNWKGTTGELRVNTFGYSLKKDATAEEHVKRYDAIAQGIVNCLSGWPTKAVAVEDHAFGMGGAGSAKVRELHGAVKLAIWRALGIAVLPVNISTGRKTLLQKCPQKGAKQFTADNVRRLKGDAIYWDADQVDAFVIANHMVMLEGGTPLSFLGVK